MEFKIKLDDLKKGADLMNKYSSLNGAKYFSSNGLQN